MLVACTCRIFLSERSSTSEAQNCLLLTVLAHARCTLDLTQCAVWVGSEGWNLEVRHGKSPHLFALRVYPMRAVYDVTRRDTFEDLEAVWLREVDMWVAH